MINFDDNGMFWLKQLGPDIGMFMTATDIQIIYNENLEPIIIPLRKLAEANKMYLTDKEVDRFVDTVKYEIETGFGL